MAPQVLLSVSTHGWAFENIATQVARHLGGRFDFKIEIASEHDPGSVDLLVVFYWDDIDRILAKVKPKRLLACIYDHVSWTGGRKAVALRQLGRANAVICGNTQIAAELKAAGLKRPTFVCPDGVDLGLFRPLPLPEKFTVGWCGNALARGDDFKGIGLIRKAAAQAGVPLVIQEYKERVPQTEMPERFYQRISAYVCASVSEGTPNPVLEALACSRPVITTRVGVTGDLVSHGVNGLFAERDISALAAAIQEVSGWRIEARQNACRKAVEEWGWDRAAKRWEAALTDVFKPEYDLPVTARFAPPEAEVTVFLISTGDTRSREACEAALAKQDVPFVVDVIENVAPMSAAFQQMNLRCRTQFYIQLDEDMVLGPGAVARLLREIQAQSKTTALVCGALDDVDAERPLYGVKIYRHEVAKMVPFKNGMATDITHNERLKRLGYKLHLLPLGETLGKHAPFHTPRSVYKRWYRLAIKQRQYGQMRWVDDRIPWLLDRWRKTGKTLHLYALMGAIAGVTDSAPADKEDDFRAPMPAFDRLAALFPPGDA